MLVETRAISPNFKEEKVSFIYCFAVLIKFYANILIFSLEFYSFHNFFSNIFLSFFLFCNPFFVAILIFEIFSLTPMYLFFFFYYWNSSFLGILVLPNPLEYSLEFPTGISNKVVSLGKIFIES